MFSLAVKPPFVRAARRGITLIEVLLTIAILALLLSLSVAGFKATRQSARSARKLSDTRQIGAAVQAYASSSRDLPPVVFPKPLIWPETIQTVTVHGAKVSGTWFANGSSFYLLIDPFLPAEMLRAGSPLPSRLETDAGNTLDWTPYQLTHTLFAGVDYWVPARQRPLAAWGAQTIDGVSVPSQKGLIVHPHYVETSALGQPILEAERAKSGGPEGVCWFDLSASVPKESELKPGVANRFRWGVNPGTLTEYDAGPTILNTYLGLSGIDR